MHSATSKALTVAAVLGAALALPAPAAEEKPGSKQVNPRVIIVVECARRADVKAARNFVAYITRKLPPNAVGGSILSRDGMVTITRCVQYVAGASLASARKRAEREKAVAIVRVRILNRRPPAGRRVAEMRADCSAYLPTTVGDAGRATWKVRKAKLLPPKRNICSSNNCPPDRPNDPFDFLMMRSDLTELLYDAMLEIAKPALRNAPKSGDRLEVTITNHSPYRITGFRGVICGKGVLVQCEYRGNPLPPGEHTVAIKV